MTGLFGLDAGTVHVEQGENSGYFRDIDTPRNGPLEDFKVFPTFPDAVEYAVAKQFVALVFSHENTELRRVQLFPADTAFKVLKPSGAAPFRASIWTG